MLSETIQVFILSLEY